MSWRVVPFALEHLAALDAQAAQPELGGDRLAIGAQLSATGRCFSLLRLADERPVFCGGVLSTHADYATMWAAFARDAGPAMLAIERRTRRLIAMLPERRIDAAVRADYGPARRWVERLGFFAEAQLGGYFEDGGDAVIYRLGRG